MISVRRLSNRACMICIPFFLVLSIPKANSAEFRLQQAPLLSSLSIVIAGDIEEGDYSRLIEYSKKALKALKEGGGKFSGVDLRIASPGGNLAEAMKMGRAIREMRFRTSIGDPVQVFNNVEQKCLSACFFVLAGGVSRTGPYAGEVSSPVGAPSEVLGVHRPYFEKAYFAGLSVAEAQKRYADLQQESRQYLLDMGVSESFVHQMFAVPSSAIKFVTSEEFDREVGNAAYYEEWVIANCGENLTNEEWNTVFSYKLAGTGTSAVPKGYIDYLEKKEKDYIECSKRSPLSDRMTVMERYLNNK